MKFFFEPMPKAEGHPQPARIAVRHQDIYAHFCLLLGWRCKCGDNRVSGSEMRRGHDEYVAVARCYGCKAFCGTLYAKVDTIFGIEEDDAVLNGRARVYDAKATR